MRRMNDPVPPPLPGPQKSDEMVYLIAALRRLDGSLTLSHEEAERIRNTPYKIVLTPEYNGLSSVVSAIQQPRPQPEMLGQDVG